MVFNDVSSLWGQTVSFLSNSKMHENSQLGIYLNYLIPETFSDTELVVSTDNPFVKNWIERNYFPYIEEAISIVVGNAVGFKIIISKDDPSADTKKSTPFVEDHSPISIPATIPAPSYMNHKDDPVLEKTSQTPYITKPATLEMKTEQRSEPQLDQEGFVVFHNPVETKTNIISDERTFDSFVVGDSNRYAYSTALGVAQSPGNIFNPLFIYGGSGLGKTHLLIAIENYIKKNHPDLKTTYAQASDFVKDFTTMIYDDAKRREFEQRYHNVDVILLDDVQYLEGKVETTEEAFQILNSFLPQNKQVVLSADRAPNQIVIDRRYTSRFASGSTIDIQPPSFEVKAAIFERYFEYCCHKINRLDLIDILTREIIDRIIDLSSNNIRELNGAAISLVAYLSDRQNAFYTLTVEEVEQWVSNIFMKNEEKRIDISGIQKEVELFYKINHSDLISKKRSQGISYPRQIAMYLTRKLTGESFPDIGKAFGGKDHTSVMYACNNIERKRQSSKKIDIEIDNLVKLIKE